MQERNASCRSSLLCYAHAFVVFKRTHLQLNAIVHAYARIHIQKLAYVTLR